jgi:hypothetical protein
MEASQGSERSVSDYGRLATGTSEAGPARPRPWRRSIAGPATRPSSLVLCEEGNAHTSIRAG